jgi:CO/xanthine dehydrogenase Mo-binding subunit
MAQTTAAPGERTWRERFAVDDRRIDGDAKVSGQATYTADTRLPGMLWAAFANSPFPHARVRSVDTSAALAVPGVHAVISGLELGPINFGRRLHDRPVLAYDYVRFVGDRVAAVAAETKAAAEEAARLIAIDYEELPGVYDTAAALLPDAPILHPNAHRYRFDNGTRPARAHENLQGSNVVMKGDSDLAPHFAAAHRVFEHRFRTGPHHHGYLEPHATVVWIDADEVLHIQSPCKAPFRLREQLALVTGMPREKIVIERPSIGGDFGGKGIVIDEFPCYFLARKTGRPVKYVSTLMDDMRAMGVRHGAEITLRTGVDAGGRFLVHEASVDYDGGAYAAAKPSANHTPGQIGFATIGYQIPHVRLNIRVVYTNNTPASHVRAPADVQTVFAWESHVDLMAEALGIDPFDLRLRNVMADGDTAITGEAMHHPRGREVLETLRRESRWDETGAKPGRGRGIGFTCRHTGGGKTNVRLQLTSDGLLHVISGVPDQGSGSATMMNRVVSAALSVDPRRVRVRHENTANALSDPGAGASRVTHIVGSAAHVAAEALRARMTAELGLRLSDDRFVDDAGGSALSFEDAAAQLCADGPVEVVGSYDGTHESAEHPADYSFSAFVVDVDVDRDTGMFRIADAVFVVDVGTIINPVTHQGQIDGGYIYGYGNACLEEMPREEGRCSTLSLADYKLPTIADIPPLRTVLLEQIDAGGPFGAKMAGELSNAAIAPAIANAIANAMRVRVNELPITAERVYNALVRAR